MIVTAIAVTGCASQSASALPIKIASAYVMQANGVKTVDAYFVLANPGPADQLVAVHSSAGGKVLMLDPDAQGVLGSSGVKMICRGFAMGLITLATCSRAWAHQYHM